MKLEKIEHRVVDRVLELSPLIESAEVLVIEPLHLPKGMQGQGYIGAVTIGMGGVVQDASISPIGSDSFSLKGSVRAKTMAATFFAMVNGQDIHVYLENQSILQFVAKEVRL